MKYLEQMCGELTAIQLIRQVRPALHILIRAAYMKGDMPLMGDLEPSIDRAVSHNELIVLNTLAKAADLAHNADQEG